MSDTLAVGEVGAAVFVSPHPSPVLDPGPALVALLESAKTSILFGIYALTLPEVAAVLISKHRAGLRVRGLMDGMESLGPTSQYRTLKAAGVDVRVWGSRYQLMHDKVAVVDGDRVAIGSWNWTRQAEHRNLEVLTILHGTRIGTILGPVISDQLERAYAAGR